jgi:hypothetical protein
MSKPKLEEEFNGIENAEWGIHLNSSPLYPKQKARSNTLKKRAQRYWALSKKILFLYQLVINTRKLLLEPPEDCTDSV